LPFKLPVSTLALVHTQDLRVLLIERADAPGYWQSVTGSQEPGETLAETATRELAEETGDLMFALVNLARHVDADPEAALRATNAKFERRFAFIERALDAQGRTLEQASLAEMDALWNAAKTAT